MRLHKKAVSAALAAALLTGAAAIPQAAAAGPDTHIPILTYHNLTRNPDATDSMTLTDERFRLDMEFLDEFGFTPLLSQDLIAISQGSMEMPENPVMITFDDGYRSNYVLAYPILQQTGMKAVISVVVYNMDETEAEGTPAADSTQTSGAADKAAEDQADGKPAEDQTPAEEPAQEISGHLTWDQMREMVASGLVEIGSHTYNLHNPEYGGMGAPDGINGVMHEKGESFLEYSDRVGSDLQKSIEVITERTGQEHVLYFAYPFGAYDKWMEKLLDDYGVAVSVWSNNGKPANIAKGLRNLSRYGIRMEQSVSELLQQTDTAEPAQAAVSVNGEQTELPAYNIDGNNYVRVRDVAVLLGGTESGYDVQWNAGAGRVELTSHASYTPIGSENAPLPAGSRTVQSYPEPTVADGTAHMVAAYQIDGCTYYKLRSLGELCGFQVDWNEAEGVVEVMA